MILRVAAAVATFATALAAADDIPAWVKDAAAQQSPSYPVLVSAVVLLQEEHLTVDSEGRRTMRERGAIRILQRSREAVSAYRTYNTKTGRIRAFQGWIVPPSGKPTPISRNQTVDVALSTDYTYDESRAKRLSPGELPPGSVFAWEIVEEEKTIFTQYHYSFQQQLPVLVSRFAVTLPSGWEASGTLLNHTDVQPAVAGATSTWELRGLPWIEPEDHSPDFHAIVPRLALTYYPASTAREELKPLRDWSAVSAWLSGFIEPSTEVTDAIRSKAAELTKTETDEIGKIRAVTSFVQQTNYVSVQMNITRGGGYTPNRAADVLARNYGDCKDKAALTRALLKAIGIESFLAPVYSGDARYVWPEWASPLQFNHVIIAIRVPPETALPAVFDHPKLGRMLVFDPTDPYTPFGDLPEDEQGSYALIAAGIAGDLVRLPLLPASPMESHVEGRLSLSGALEARIVRTHTGQSAVRIRALARSGNERLREVFERNLARRLGGISLKTIEAIDDMPAGKLELKMDVAAVQFGQIMQGRLLLLRPSVLVANTEYVFGPKERKLPIQLDASARNDVVRIWVPDGFEIDEIPDAVSVDSRYGSYRAKWIAADREVIYEQTVEIKKNLVPAAEYANVREFFENLWGGQQSPVVLVKQ